MSGAELSVRHSAVRQLAGSQENPDQRGANIQTEDTDTNKDNDERECMMCVCVCV